MDNFLVTHIEHVAEGMVEVSARTTRGEAIKIRLLERYVGTELMYRALSAAAVGTDIRSGALAARSGRTDQEEA